MLRRSDVFEAPPEQAHIVVNLITHSLYVAIVGTRSYPHDGRARVAGLISHMAENSTVVTGGAPGPDTWAEELAAERGIRCAVVRPSKMGLHLAADYMGRNTIIVRGSEVLVAFWDGASKGTKDAIEKAIDIHRQAIVVLPGKAPVVWVPNL
jgi:predicted esterase YcpF (UPF0227 family)